MQNSKAEPLKFKSDVSLLWAKRWIRCAGALLLLVAFSKWLSIWEGTEVLAAVDPLTGIRYGTLLTVALFFELCLAYAAFEFPLGWGTLYGIGWLGSGFSGYRLARLHGDIEAPCKCLGHFLEWWPWAKDREEFLAWMILACLLGAALFALPRKSPHRIFVSSPG